MSIWYKEAGGMYVKGKTKAFTRNIYIEPHNIESIKQRFNNKDVYVTPYAYNRRPQKESQLYAGFYIDLDLKVSNLEDYEKVKLDTLMVLSIFTTEFKIPLKYIDTYFSGNKGFHIVIHPIVLGILPKKDLNFDFKLLAKRIKSYTLNKTIDTVVYDNVRLMRVNNTINSKSGLYKVRVTRKMIEKFTYEQMKLYASKPRYELHRKAIKFIPEAGRKYLEYIELQRKEEEEVINRPRKQLKKMDELLPCLMYILENPPEKGNRNNTAILLASSLFQCGGTTDEVTDTLLDWNNNNPNRLTDHEIRNTVMSAYRQFKDGRGYGCQSARSLGYCLGHLCKLYRGV